MLLQVTLFIALLAFAYSDCVLYTPVPGPPQSAVANNATTPQPYGQDWTAPIACPEFQYNNSCCTGYINGLQSDNFQKLSSAFGNNGGGCDLCAANLMRFFCWYSCSPDQDKFMTFNGYENITITDEDNNVVTINVTSVSVNVSADMSCGIFESCQKISFMTEISAGSSALGFITFLFDRGSDTSLTKDYVNIVNTGGLSMSTPPHTCNETVSTNGTDMYGYPIAQNCSCNYCSDSCSPLTMITYGSITDGFNLRDVILTYICAVLLTLGCMFLKGFRKNRAAHKIRADNNQTGGLASNLMEGSGSRDQ